MEQFEQGPRSHPSPQGPQPTVVICDDDPLVHAAATLRLRGAFHLLHATDEAELTARLGAHPAALVLLDLCLAGREAGLEVLARLRAHFPSATVIVHTGLDDEGTVGRAIALGAVDYVTKADAGVCLARILTKWAHAVG